MLCVNENCFLYRKHSIASFLTWTSPCTALCYCSGASQLDGSAETVEPSMSMSASASESLDTQRKPVEQEPDQQQDKDTPSSEHTDALTSEQKAPPQDSPLFDDEGDSPVPELTNGVEDSSDWHPPPIAFQYNHNLTLHRQPIWLACLVQIKYSLVTDSQATMQAKLLTVSVNLFFCLVQFNPCQDKQVGSIFCSFLLYCVKL